MKYCSLRYFNAAGAAPAHLGANIGEWHEPETHLIPLVLRAALDSHKNIRVYGTDYDTPDGTCIRDYIHVADLANAHVLAMQRLEAGEKGCAFNLGNGRGHSVREVIDCVKRVTDRPIAVIKEPRGSGDPLVLVGDSARARTELGWSPRFTDLDRIVDTAWAWENRKNELLNGASGGTIS